MAKLRIDWFRAETVGDFGELKRFFQRVDAQLEEASRLALYVFKSQPQSDDWNAHQEAFQQEVDEHNREFKETLPRILSYSLVSSLYTVVEYRLKGLCDQLKKRRDLPCSISAFHGDPVERTTNFLRAYRLSNLLPDEVQRLREFIWIRNCIVHNIGFLERSPKEKELRQLIKSKSNGLSEDWEKRVVVPKCYVEESHAAFLAMFRRLFQELEFGPENYIVVEDA